MRNSCTCPDQFRASTPARLVPVENGLLGNGDATRIGVACSLHSCCSWVAAFIFPLRWLERTQGGLQGHRPRRPSLPGGYTIRNLCSLKSEAVAEGVKGSFPAQSPNLTSRVPFSYPNSVQSPARGSAQRHSRLFPRAVAESTSRVPFSSQKQFTAYSGSSKNVRPMPVEALCPTTDPIPTWQSFLSLFSMFLAY